MKIWQIDPANITPYYNIALCDGLAQLGCEVYYISSEFIHDASLPIPDSFVTDYHYFRGLNHPLFSTNGRIRQISRGLSYPIGHWRLVQKIKHEKPDIVHIQWSRLPRFDNWLIQQIKKLNIPIVHTVHNVDRAFDSQSSLEQINQIYSEVDHLILHTQANQQELQKQIPHLPADKMSIIPMVAQNNASIPENASPSLARKQLQLSDETFIVSYFGLIRAYKGVDILLKAFREQLSQLDNFLLMIIGKSNDIATSQELEEIATHDKIIVINDYVPNNDVWLYHLAADVMVFPYRSITQSAALITAMGFGLPVIVTDVGGFPETIDGNGYIVPSEDAVALANSIIHAYQNRDELLTMGKKSKQIIDSTLHPVQIATQLLDIYQRILKARTS